MKNITVCFTGHRKIPTEQKEEITEKLRNTIIELINKGYCCFYAGGALGFDTLAAQMVLSLKKDYPQIKLELALPCKNQTNRWHKNDIIIYNKIKDSADEITYVVDLYYRGCMQKRNRYLVENSDVCVCYLTKKIGGTFYTVNYAMENGLDIINIAE